MSAATALYKLTLGTENLVVNSVTANNLAFTEVSVDNFQVNLATVLKNKVEIQVADPGTGTVNEIYTQLPINFQLSDGSGDTTYVIPVQAGQPGQVLAMPQTGTELVWQNGGGSGSGVNSISAGSNFSVTGTVGPDGYTGNVGINLANTVYVDNLAINNSLLPQASVGDNGLFIGCVAGEYQWANPSQGGSTIVDGSANILVTNVGSTYTVATQPTISVTEMDAVTIKLNGLTIPVPDTTDTVLGYNGTTMDWVPQGGSANIIAGTNIVITPGPGGDTISTLVDASFGNTTVETLILGAQEFPVPTIQNSGETLQVDGGGAYQLVAFPVSEVTGSGNIAVSTGPRPNITTNSSCNFGTLASGSDGGITAGTIDVNNLSQSNGTIELTYPDVNFTTLADAGIVIGYSMVVKSLSGGVANLGFEDVSGGGGGNTTITSDNGTIVVTENPPGTFDLAVKPDLTLDSLTVYGSQLPNPTAQTNGYVIGTTGSAYEWIPQPTGSQPIQGSTNVNVTPDAPQVVSLTNDIAVSGELRGQTISGYDGTNLYSLTTPEQACTAPVGYVLGISAQHISTGPGDPYVATLAWVDPSTAGLPPFSGANDNQVLTVVDSALAWQEPTVNVDQFETDQQVVASLVGAKVALNLSAPMYGYAAGLVTFDGTNYGGTVIKAACMNVNCVVQRLGVVVTVYFFTGVTNIDMIGADCEFVQTRLVGGTNSFQSLLIDAGVPSIVGPVAGPTQFVQVTVPEVGYEYCYIVPYMNGETLYMQRYNTNTPFVAPVNFTTGTYLMGSNETITTGELNASGSDFTMVFTIPPF